MSLSSSQKWADPAFLKPQIPDDPLLMFDFDQELTAEAGVEEEEENGFEIDISRELNDQIAKNPVSLTTATAGRLSPEVMETTENLQRKRNIFVFPFSFSNSAPKRSTILSHN